MTAMIALAGCLALGSAAIPTMATSAAPAEEGGAGGLAGVVRGETHVGEQPSARRLCVRADGRLREARQGGRCRSKDRRVRLDRGKLHGLLSGRFRLCVRTDGRVLSRPKGHAGCSSKRGHRLGIKDLGLHRSDHVRLTRIALRHVPKHPGRRHRGKSIRHPKVGNTPPLTPFVDHQYSYGYSSPSSRWSGNNSQWCGFTVPEMPTANAGQTVFPWCGLQGDFEQITDSTNWGILQPVLAWGNSCESPDNYSYWTFAAMYVAPTNSAADYGCTYGDLLTVSPGDALVSAMAYDGSQMHVWGYNCGSGLAVNSDTDLQNAINNYVDKGKCKMSYLSVPKASTPAGAKSWPAALANNNLMMSAAVESYAIDNTVSSQWPAAGQWAITSWGTYQPAFSTAGSNATPPVICSVIGGETTTNPVQNCVFTWP